MRTQPNKTPHGDAIFRLAFSKLRTAFVFALPVVLFFGYYPVITFASSDSMNFDLTLPFLWLLFFALFSLPTFFRDFISAFKNRHFLLPFICLAPLYATISICWSSNFLRALLTAGIFWCVVISAVSIIELVKTFTKTKKTQLLKVFFISAGVFCIWCWLQCILDIAGVSREYTLLCVGCTYQAFGFPHPNGFAIEPQFMGNLLLAPAILALYIITKNPTYWKILTPLCCLFVATLFLTFSRGAIYAFAIALVITMIIALKNHFFRLRLILIPAISFVTVLVCQGCFAVLSPAHLDFWTAETRAIHQLSLGVIDLRPAEQAVDSQSTVTDSITVETAFTGYVSESTNVRLALSDAALSIWSSTPQNLIFGTGLGSAGTVISVTYPDFYSKKEIIQNEYINILLELGLFGLVLICLAVIFLCAALYKLAPKTFAILLSLLAAYAVTLCFFSGFSSALQIYLLPPLFSAVFFIPTKNQSAEKNLLKI